MNSMNQIWIKIFHQDIIESSRTIINYVSYRECDFIK